MDGTDATTPWSWDLEQTHRIDELCDRFESDWRAGVAPRVEDYLTEVPEPFRPRLRVELEALAAELDRGARTLAGRGGPAPGMIIGDYELLEPLGQGGMGHVFKARHRAMGRIVALKCLAPDLAHRDAIRSARRFRREIRATARLSHPNIVTAHDAGEHEGIPYLVMELIDGLDLARLVRQDGPLPVALALDLMLQAARGLEYAHAQGIVHRDIKPSNLLVGPDGVLKVLDLGLARFQAVEATEVSAELTATGTFLGSIDYMAPEQSLDTRRADGRCDIYGLGGTLHYLLTGHPPYQGATSLERLLAHREAPVPSLRARRPDCPEVLDSLFRRMLAKSPEQRPASMGQLVEEVERCRAGLGPEHTRAPQEMPQVGRPVPIRADAPTLAPSRPGAEPAPDHAAPGPTSSSVKRGRPIVTGAMLRRARWPTAGLLLVIFAALALALLQPRPPEPALVFLMTDQRAIDGALVHVDGRRVSQFSAIGDALPFTTFEVSPGRHHLRITKPGFEPFEVDFDLRPRQRWEIPIRLMRGSAVPDAADHGNGRG
jgi:serine/threonine protein kinase